jgi:26S proteasome regulatory subunit N5
VIVLALFLGRFRLGIHLCSLDLIQEESGDTVGAANVLQEVHVETYGSLSKKEKVEFILEQIRLTLAKQDYVRAASVSAKISKKT